MQWIQYDIYTSTAQIDALCDRLTDIGVEGVAISDSADFAEFLAGKQGRWDYIDDEVMKLQNAETKVTFYLPEGDQGQQLLEAAGELVAALRKENEDGRWGRLATGSTSLREEDWAEGWKKYYVPTRIGKKLVVCPSWEQYQPQPEDVVIHLDPGMAFGTGTHQSTRMCMAHTENHLNAGDTVLDIGCGSGILAVTALLLGASSAVGVDLEEVAVVTARENAILNHVEDKATFLMGDLAAQVTGTFDLIYANIVADVICRLCPSVPGLLNPGGRLITSGIIDTREADVLAALEQSGLTVIDRLTEGGWVSLCCERKA
ncbi:50S ribosomal protein L11 methyltransferase [Oscillospiraceae bacterium MB08-C2-2]|nr:50S ribosomal protein L11 methyltransferase [Oscillospiraceae bacterium MB08-C2-2]